MSYPSSRSSFPENTKKNCFFPAIDKKKWSSQVHRTQIYTVRYTMENYKMKKTKNRISWEKGETDIKDQTLHTWKVSYRPNSRDGIRCG